MTKHISIFRKPVTASAVEFNQDTAKDIAAWVDMTTGWSASLVWRAGGFKGLYLRRARDFGLDIVASPGDYVIWDGNEFTVEKPDNVWAKYERAS